MEQPISSSTNSLLSSTPVWGNKVDDLLNVSALQVNSSATIVVNSIDDVADNIPGVTTLRNAINQANADPGSDLIVFDQSLFSRPQTITLSQGELDITHSLDIMAPQDSLTGQSLLTVSANNSSRVFEIEPAATVNMSGLIIADGNATGDSGGGIKNSGTLILNSSTVRNNSATLVAIAGGDGGGIYNTGNLTVNNSTISANQASFFGGIYNSGSLRVSTSTISANSANIGGGFYNNGNLTMSDSIISANQADISAGIENAASGILVATRTTISTNWATNSNGGIRNLGTANINNSVINGNTAGFAGGGIGIECGTVTLSNTSISGNTAGLGGGIIITNNLPNLNNITTVTVSNSLISDNFATFEGGGLSVQQRSTVTVSYSTITDNSSGASGGGIVNSDGSTLMVNESTITSNSAGGNSNGSGGGIYNSGRLTISHSTISSNSTSQSPNNNGGGIYNSIAGNLSVTNSTISGNSATEKGGGIYNDYTGTVTLLFSTLTKNQASNGGGVYQNDVPLLPNDLPGSKSVRNTIIASNLNTADGVNPDVSGTFSSNGYNLIGDGTGSTGFDAKLDIVGTSSSPIDPLLASLDFYGGPTQTIALLPGSPAIGAADPTVLDTDPTGDQRGFPRRGSDGNADIGAFEFSRA